MDTDDEKIEVMFDLKIDQFDVVYLFLDSDEEQDANKDDEVVYNANGPFYLM